MPLNSHQLAALVERARQKAPPVVSPPAARPKQPASGSPAPSTARPPPALSVESTQVIVADPGSSPAPPAPTPQPEHAEPTDFPIGWQLSKESWHFHRRFYRVFRRPMERGEYSYLLHQIPGRAEHLGEDCWRVTLPHGKRTLAIRATRWRLITILPKDWQPPLASELRQTAQRLSVEPGG